MNIIIIAVLTFLAFVSYCLIMRIVYTHRAKVALYMLDEIKAAEAKFVAEHGETAQAKMLVSAKANVFLSQIGRKLGCRIKAEVDPKLHGLSVYFVKTEEKTIGFHQ